MQQVTEEKLQRRKKKDTRISEPKSSRPKKPPKQLDNKENSNITSKIVDRVFQLLSLILLYKVFVFATEHYLEKSPDLLGKVLIGILAVILVVFGLGGVVEKFAKK
jgi:hypothetical protein